jgi:hypothetical protein
MRRFTMTEKDWDIFYDLLERIVAQPETWEQKKETVETEADRCGANTTLEEFVGWFTE